MTTKLLHIGPGLALPTDAVTQTFAILARRGVGKTYTAAVLTEELLKAHLPVVVVDPVGVWWGLRSSADGKAPGFPILVFGGDHGDVPLEATGGAAVADLIVDERVSCVLDLSELRKGEQTSFMTSFAERLYHRKANHRDPLHLVLDEADAFAPQRTQHGQDARCLGVIEDLVRRGRARGLGITLITQRAAVLNKDVLTRVEVLVALRTIAPQDREAIDAWVKVHGTPEQRKEMMESLPSLPIGTAWFWSPGWLDEFKRVEVRKRETFDSSSTPKAGQAAHAPKTVARVDLAAVRTKMAATIEKAKADDPKLLRTRVAELERELAKARTTVPAPKVERVEVPALSAADVGRLEAFATRMDEIALRGSFHLTMATSPLSALRASRRATPTARPSCRPASPSPAHLSRPRAPARGAPCLGPGGSRRGSRWRGPRPDRGG